MGDQSRWAEWTILAETLALNYQLQVVLSFVCGELVNINYPRTVISGTRVFCYPPSSGDIGQCLRTCWLSQVGNEASGIQWVEAWDVTKLPTMHRSTIKNLQFKVSVVPRLRNPVLKEYCADDTTEKRQAIWIKW